MRQVGNLAVQQSSSAPSLGDGASRSRIGGSRGACFPVKFLPPARKVVHAASGAPDCRPRLALDHVSSCADCDHQQDADEVDRKLHRDIRADGGQHDMTGHGEKNSEAEYLQRMLASTG